MYKFAHIADCHLGSQKFSELKKLEINTFKSCLDKCMEEKVDFIIIAGDLFHSNLPDMGVVKEAVVKLKEVNEQKIPVYINYGSHDFSPNETSIIDIITESGLLKKLFVSEIFEDDTGEEKLGLKFIVDKKTNAKLTGISGRKMGIEDTYFKMLDKERLENEKGFKIFVFHTSIKNLLPDFLSKMDGIDINQLPKKFDYYAGGHIHKRICEDKIDNYNIITYPGPIFAGFPRDLEMSSKGEKRGFFIVEFDEEVRKVKFCEDLHFHELSLAKYQFLEFKADNKVPNQLYEEFITKIEKTDVKGKIVIFKVKGELSGGKTSDINFHKIKTNLIEKGAIHVSINHHALVSKEFSGIRVKGENTTEIEENLLLENINNINLKIETLKDRKGAELAIKLMSIIRESPKTNEKKSNYNNRILNDSLRLFNMEES